MSGSTAYLPAIPDPETTAVPALLDICQQVVEWAAGCDDLAAIREAYNRMQAVANYLARQDHSRSSQAALRRLEVRIGVLAGPAVVGRNQHGEGSIAIEPSPEVNGGDRKSDQFSSERTELPKDDLYLFRALAEHADVVDQVIAESTEQAPASRAKVLRAVKATIQHRRQAESDAEDRAHREERKRRAANNPAPRRPPLPDRSHIDSKRVARGYSAAWGIERAVRELIAEATPEDVAYFLENQDPRFAHVAVNAAAALNELLPQVHDYWKAIQTPC